MSQKGSHSQGHSDGSASPVEMARIIRDVTGDLPCIRCRYNLRGLSIRSCCPECLTPVRATILAIVDPKAGELMPLFMPKITAVGITVWAIGAFLAVIAVWGLRVAEVLRGFDFEVHIDRAPMIGFVSLLVSALGAVVLIRPHRRVARVSCLAAAVGVAAYAPLALVYWEIYAVRDASRAAFLPSTRLGSLDPERAVLRLGLGILTAIIIVGLRTNARLLAARSVVVRTGRVGRQSLLAMLAAVGLAAVGDLLHLVSSQFRGYFAELAVSFGLVFVTVGSVLLTIGLWNVCIDCIRLAPILRDRGIGLTDILETNAERDKRPTGDRA